MPAAFPCVSSCSPLTQHRCRSRSGDYLCSVATHSRTRSTVLLCAALLSDWHRSGGGKREVANDAEWLREEAQEEHQPSITRESPWYHDERSGGDWSSVSDPLVLEAFSCASTMGERRSKKSGKLKRVLQGVSTAVRITMGHAQSHKMVPALPTINPEAPPLRFHRKRGDNIVLEAGGFRARRNVSFCKGIVFSDRPLGVGEWVCIRISELSARWSGVLRVGFTQHNPALMGVLPKYACPDLTTHPGYWAKALSERYVQAGASIHYFVMANGDVHFGVNGQNRGVFFSGVDPRQPLWAMIDLYGNCTALDMVDLRTVLNNYSGLSPQNTGESTHSDPNPVQGYEPMLQLQHHRVPPPHALQPSHYLHPHGYGPEQPPLPHMGQPPPYRVHGPPNGGGGGEHLGGLEHHMNEMRVQPHRTGGGGNYPPPVATNNYRPLLFNREISFHPQCFHFCTGKTARLNESSMVAHRAEDEFAQGYVFTAAPIQIGERTVIQVLSTDDSYIGSLAFGLTNCDPSTVDTRELPEDSDMLLDRAEYWVVSKDVANSPAEGDELSFAVNPDGTVAFSKNNSPPTVFMHVDTSLRLWAFWDIYGHTSKIRIVGSTPDQVPAPILPRAGPLHQPPLTAIATAPADGGDQPQPSQAAECTICLERRVDCAVYRCGHMCMCYSCAMVQWKGPNGGYCPLCRQPIMDVMRIYVA
eukprot:maker-scaffold1526_size37455-snap-gene-0.12 protein:Tk00730 transcript:maker-scaffold1526_size37455-snap-gene-0.12-mRNA-1 annotation:"GK11419"